MLIKSYIVFPEVGRTEVVIEKLSAIEGCEVHPASNSDLLVLATVSSSQKEENEKECLIESITEIKSTALVFGNGANT